MRRRLSSPLYFGGLGGSASLSQSVLAPPIGTASFAQMIRRIIITVVVTITIAIIFKDYNRNNGGAALHRGRKGTLRLRNAR